MKDIINNRCNCKCSPCENDGSCENCTCDPCNCSNCDCDKSFDPMPLYG